MYLCYERETRSTIGGNDPEITIEPENPGLRVASERLLGNMKWLNQRPPEEFEAMEGKHIVVWQDDAGDIKSRLFLTPEETYAFVEALPKRDRIGVHTRMIDNRPIIHSPRPQPQ